jgi:hypothetical protein
MGLPKKICMDPSFSGLLNWPKIRLSRGDLMLFSVKFVWFRSFRVSEHEFVNLFFATFDLLMHQFSTKVSEWSWFQGKAIISFCLFGVQINY